MIWFAQRREGAERGRRPQIFVITAQAGTHPMPQELGSRLRGNDEGGAGRPFSAPPRLRARIFP